MVELGQITIVVTKTSDGKSDYVQIMSSDMMSINIVLVASEIRLDDARAASGSENSPDES